MHSIYLDYNATAPLSQAAQQAVVEACSYLGNPSSVHSYGRLIRQKMETARQQIADFLGVSSQRLVFTSGATEANNLALAHFPGRIIISAIEHDSVRLARDDAVLIPVSEQGVIDLEALENLLAQPYIQGPTLVSVMAANNETGVIQPLDQVMSLAKQYGAWVHSDSVQGINRLQFPWRDLDMMSISAHKLGGPPGVGCLVIPANWPIKLKPLIKGGGQERFYRAGTENVAGILGFAAACLSSQDRDWSFVNSLRLSLEKTLKTLNPDSVIFGEQAPRLPNTTLISMPGVKSETQVMNFDLLGFAVSSGSACSSGKVRTSNVLQAMNVPACHRNSALRISLGPDTTSFEIQAFTKAWGQLLTRVVKPEAPLSSIPTFKKMERDYRYGQVNVS